MNRILLVLLLFSACLSACKKTNDVAAQIQAQSVIDDKIITTYLNSKGLPVNQVDTISTTTGVPGPTGECYIINSPGSGNTLFTSSTQVTVGYTGQILAPNGTLGPIFAQTNDFHPSYVLGEVIRGWQIGIPKISIGGTITLYIPSRYAYGPYDQPQPGSTGNSVHIPANSVLVFNITLYNVTNQ